MSRLSKPCWRQAGVPSAPPKSEHQAGNQAIVVHRRSFRSLRLGWPIRLKNSKERASSGYSVILGKLGEADRPGPSTALPSGSASPAIRMRSGADAGGNRGACDRAQARGRQVPCVEAVFTLRQAQRLDANNAFSMGLMAPRRSPIAACGRRCESSASPDAKAADLPGRSIWFGARNPAK